MNFPVLGDPGIFVYFISGIGFFGALLPFIPSIIGGIGSLFGGGGKKDGGGGGSGGFGSALLGALPGAIGAAASLFQGGGSVEDLPPQLLDMMNLQANAGRQAEALRGDTLGDIRTLRDIEHQNALAVGAFDPTTLGPQFSFLGPTVDQFSGVNRRAGSIRNALNPTMQLIQLAQQAMGGGGTALGASGQINAASLAAGQGAGQGTSNFLATLLGQQLLNQQGQGDAGFSPAPILGPADFTDDPAEAEFPGFTAPPSAPPIAGGQVAGVSPFIDILQQGGI
jgi:hypothetical protein